MGRWDFPGTWDQLGLRSRRPRAADTVGGPGGAPRRCAQRPSCARLRYRLLQAGTWLARFENATRDRRCPPTTTPVPGRLSQCARGQFFSIAAEHLLLSAGSRRCRSRRALLSVLVDRSQEFERVTGGGGHLPAGDTRQSYLALRRTTHIDAWPQSCGSASSRRRIYPR
jgi:hypothetical protein